MPVLAQATKEHPSDPRGFAYLAATYFKLGVAREFEAARDRAIAPASCALFRDVLSFPDRIFPL